MSSNAQESDVLILGGGVIGLCTAWYLLRAGRSVRVLEAERVGAGSSHGNCGTITPSHAPLTAPGMVGKALASLFDRRAPFYVKPTLDVERLAWLLGFARRCTERQFRHVLATKNRLMLASRSLLDELVAEAALDCGFSASGTLYVYRDARTFEHGCRESEAVAAIGVPVETLDAAALQAREPTLKPGMAGGHFHPGDARLRPDRYVAELARAVRAAGGEIIENAPVSGFVQDGRRLRAALTPQGAQTARDIVLALGAWSPRLARPLGLRLPMQPGKGYSITYTRPQRAPETPLVLKERGVCVTTWADGYRLGSTMEFSGYNRALDRRRLDALRFGAAEYLVEPEGPQVEETWYGWRPMSVDELPIIGRAPGWENLMLATGHGMLGVTLSAATGRLVSELLTGTAPFIDPAPYAATRF